ncbi:MAG TPA: TOBE-like domain-containing protein, partial [Candidatus Obscuribacterales bacterium]
VTHDQEEAMEIADEIVVMNQGQIEQIGAPAEVYENPATPFVMSFIGAVNVLSPDAAWRSLPHDIPHHGEVFLRPHDIEITLSATSDSLSATVDRFIHLGWTIRVELTLANGQPVTAHINREQLQCLQLHAGQAVFLQPKAIRSFGPDAVPQAALV